MLLEEGVVLFEERWVLLLDLSQVCLAQTELLELRTQGVGASGVFKLLELLSSLADVPRTLVLDAYGESWSRELVRQSCIGMDSNGKACGGHAGGAGDCQ